MASKKQRASGSARAGGAAPPQPQRQQPTQRVSAMLGTLRLVALMSATIVALLVYEVLQTPIGFWPALGVGFVAGILARAAFIWLERVWLRATARKAQAKASASGADGAKPKGKPDTDTRT
jgi:hypothetical protein